VACVAEKIKLGVPRIASPCLPDGKNALAPPVSWQMSKWKGLPCWLLALDVVWPHHSWLPWTGHMSVTFTTMEWKGPVNWAQCQLSSGRHIWPSTYRGRVRVG
jgi:hypothetical protein